MRTRAAGACLALVEGMLRNIEGPLGIYLRRAWYRRRLGSCGQQLRIEPGVHLVGAPQMFFGDSVWLDRGAVLVAADDRASRGDAQNDPELAPAPGTLSLGDFSHVGLQSIIQAHGGVRAGDGFTTSAGVKVYSMSNVPHGCRAGTHPDTEPAAEVRRQSIEIGRNVWLGLNVVALGCSIGDDTFVQANGLVMGTHRGGVILGGQPATPQRPRFPAS